MAILSNINDKFRVDSAGAVYFGTSAGTNGLILKSVGTGGSPVWVDPNTVGTGPWLPLAGGAITGNLTIGGTLGVTGAATFGGTAIFDGDMTLPAAADHFLIGAGSLATTGKIKFGAVSWNNNIGLESYWMVMGSNQNEGYKFRDSAGSIYVQFNGGNNGAGANYSYFKGRIGIGTTSPNARLKIEGDAATNGLSIKSGGNGGTYPLMVTWTGGTEGDTFCVDDNLRVGIGTTSPDAKLHVVSDEVVLGSVITDYRDLAIQVATAQETANSGTGISFDHGALGAAIASARVNNSTWGTDLRFYTHPDATTNQRNVTERMRINAVGDVGIGTPSPGHKLVSSVASPGYSVVGQHASGGQVGIYNSTGDNGIGTINNYAFNLFTNNSAPQVTVTTSGKVGIGVTGPAAKLHVKDGDFSLEQTGGDGNKIFLTTDHAAHYIKANGYWVDIIGNAAEVFRVFGGVGGTTEFMRVTGTGYTKLTDDGDTTWQGYNFHAITQSRASEPTVMIYNDNTGGNNFGVNVIHRSSGSGTTGRFFFGGTSNGSTEKIKIYTNGSIENATNSYGQLSDLKLKENVVDATSKLDDIMKVKIKNFNYIGDDLKQLGVIAQELEEVFPGLVYDTPDSTITNKKEVFTGTSTKGVKYSIFVPMLVKAMQEQQVIIEDLKSRLKILEKK